MTEPGHDDELIDIAPGDDRPEDRLGGADDPLLDCLVFLTRYHGNPKSRAVLTAGLPMAGPRMSASLFVRAAERVGLSAKVVRRRLWDIPRLVLPAVLILDQGRACVLLSLSKRDKAEIYLPETGGVQEISITDLAQEQTGYAIYLRPVFKFERRDSNIAAPRPRSWFWGTIGRHWWSYVEVAVAATMINLFALATPLFIMTVYDRVVPNNAIETLWVLAAGVSAIFLFDFLLKILRGYFLDHVGRNADVLLASRLFDQVLNMRLAARPQSAGAFANSLREFEALRDFLTSATLAAVIDLPFVVFFVAAIWWVGGPIAQIHLVAVPLVLVVGLLLQFPLNGLVKRNLREAEEKHGVLVESLGGLETVKALGAEARIREKWEALVGLTALSGLRARVLSQTAIHFAAMVTQITAVIVVVYGVFLIQDGIISVGALIACVMLSNRALAPMVQVAQLLTRFHRARAALHALDRLMKAPVERPPEMSFLHRAALKGSVRFQDVRFAYPGSDVDALRGVNLTIDVGERVGMIGRVGSGKSTVARLILGLYEPDSGAVLIDETDLRQIDPIDLRRAIGYVAQDVYLFRGTVRDNITMAMPHADDDQVLKAARLAGVDDFVSQHPMGYDFPVGERGETLSGGQRQAIAIARALLYDPPILVFDEPTSAMDNRGEAALKRRLDKILPGRTLVLITHRSSLLSMADRLVVFDRGRIVADGPRERVLEALAAGQLTTARQ